MGPGVMLASIIIANLSAMMLQDFAISGRDLMLCFYMGAFQVSASLVFYAAGARYAVAAELMVLAITKSHSGAVVGLASARRGARALPGFLGGSIVIARFSSTR